jgi:hypothetical protein
MRPATDRRLARGQFLRTLITVALAACASMNKEASDSVKPEANPLLQSQEGRNEIVARCQNTAAERWPGAQYVSFAQGRLTSTGTDGNAEYLGAMEVTSQASISQRFRFVCQIQPDGSLDIRFL